MVQLFLEYKELHQIPVDLAIRVANGRLIQVVTIHQMTSLTVVDFIEHLTFSLHTTSFVYGGTYYQQEAGH